MELCKKKKKKKNIYIYIYIYRFYNIYFIKEKKINYLINKRINNNGEKVKQ